VSVEHYIDLALSLLSAVLTVYAKAKSGQAQSHADVAATLITAIEGMSPVSKAAAKTAVADQSARMGNSDKVDQAVQNVTSRLA
jgi:hypothetical protein